MTAAHVIEIEGLSFSFNGFQVLENVNLVITERDFVSIVGPNGGGKTTLVKLILGLLHPSAGRVKIFGGPPEEHRHRIGYIPQDAGLDLRFPATVMDVVLMGRLGKAWTFGRYSRQDKEAAAAVMEKVGLQDCRGLPFSSLSGGQRQRLLIARALVCDPELLLMDEPTAHLDIAVEGEFYELLSDLNAYMTIVLVSHDLGFVSRFVRNVVCVKRQVKMHTTTEITGAIIDDMYGSPMRMVRHDHGDSEVVQRCFNS